LRDALAEARATRPDRDVLCLAYRAEENGREVARIPPLPSVFDRLCRSKPGSQLRAKNVVVVSVVVTETTFERVKSVAHTLVARIEPRDSSEPAESLSVRRVETPGPAKGDDESRAEWRPS
jgi:hypothetical protein